MLRKRRGLKMRKGKRGCGHVRYKDTNPLGLVLSRVTIQTPEELDRLQLEGLSTIEVLQSGKGTLQEIQHMLNCMNLSETLVSMGIGPEAEQSIADAHIAFLAIRKRLERWGKVEVLPAELSVLRDMYGWLDTQRRCVDRGTLDDAARLCAARLRSGHSSVREWA